MPGPRDGHRPAGRESVSFAARGVAVGFDAGQQGNAQSSSSADHALECFLGALFRGSQQLEDPPADLCPAFRQKCGTTGHNRFGQQRQSRQQRTGFLDMGDLQWV